MNDIKNVEWVRCPICRNKTRNKIREDTIFNKFSSLLSEMQTGNIDCSKQFKSNRHQRARRKDAEPMNLWGNTSQLIGSVFGEKKLIIICAYCGSLLLHFIQFSMERYCHKHRYDCRKHISNRLGV